MISPRQRSCIVKYILEQEKYGHRKIDFGLQRLLAERAYEAAYALHDVRFSFSLKEARYCLYIFNITFIG